MEWRAECLASNSSSRRISKYTTKQHPSQAAIYPNLGFCHKLACGLSLVVVHIYSPFWWATKGTNLCCYSFVVWWIGHLLRHYFKPVFQIQKLAQNLYQCRHFCIVLDACRAGKSRIFYRFSMGSDRLRTH